MNTSKPQFSLDTLAEAVAIRDGIGLDPRVENDRKRLLEIAAALLEDPVKGHDLLSLLSSSRRSRHSSDRTPPKPWAYKGQVSYLETSTPIAKDDFLFDDIDQLRTTDAFGRPLVLDDYESEDGYESEDNVQSHGYPEIQGDHGGAYTKVMIDPHAKYYAPPSLLGFQEDMSFEDFDQRAFRAALTRAQRNFSKAVRVAWPKRPLPDSSLKISAPPQTKDLWKVQKNIRAENFHEVTVTHEDKSIYLGYIGSGEDLFLVVAINDTELLKAKESLLNAKKVSLKLLDTLNAEPDAGLLIVDSILEDLPPADTLILREMEP